MQGPSTRALGNLTAPSPLISLPLICFRMTHHHVPQSSAETAESVLTISHQCIVAVFDTGFSNSHTLSTMAPKGGNAKKESGRAKKAENEVRVLFRAFRCSW